MTRWSVASIFVCGALLLTTVNGQQPQKDKDKGDDSYIDGELLVQFSPTLNVQQRNAELKNHNLARLRRFDTLDIDLVRVPRGLSVAAAAGGLKNKSGILLVQPNYVRRAITGPPPNDPFWLDGSMWGLAKIGAQSV